MYKPDKATNERNARTLRELVKQPDNKLCADCKHNDPRWASWNLGVYLCIRCSGIHRGMGTHISRIKSIDLDMWTPEQMESIQNWGNRRANIYWEAHLKPGHIPPDHKMESFIRSKYESRRWAMDGPPPADPSILDGSSSQSGSGSGSNGDATPATPAPLLDTSPAPTPSQHAPTASLSAPRPASPSVHVPSTFRQNTVRSYAQSRQLLSAAVAGRVQPATPSHSVPTQSQSQSQPTPAPQPQQSQPKPEDDLFSLDFHAPSASKPVQAPQPPAKDTKQDILSLFSAPAQPAQQPSNAFGQFTSTSTQGGDMFGAGSHVRGASQSTQPVSMMGTNGTGFWGASSGWNAPLPNTTPSSTSNIWGAPATSSASGAGSSGFSASANALNALNTTNIWGNTTGGASHTASHGSFGASKKDDVFGDLWGDFK